MMLLLLFVFVSAVVIFVVVVAVVGVCCVFFFTPIDAQGACMHACNVYIRVLNEKHALFVVEGGRGQVLSFVKRGA